MHQFEQVLLIIKNAESRISEVLNQEVSLEFVIDKNMDVAEATSNILKAIQRTTGFTLTELQSDLRTGPLSEARHMYYYFCKMLYPHIKPQAIGDVFGCDRSSVVHGQKKIKGLLKVKDDQTRMLYLTIQQRLQHETKTDKIGV